MQLNELNLKVTIQDFDEHNTVDIKEKWFFLWKMQEETWSDLDPTVIVSYDNSDASLIKMTNAGPTFDYCNLDISRA